MTKLLENTSLSKVTTLTSLYLRFLTCIVGLIAIFKVIWHLLAKKIQHKCQVFVIVIQQKMISSAEKLLNWTLISQDSLLYSQYLNLYCCKYCGAQTRSILDIMSNGERKTNYSGSIHSPFTRNWVDCSPSLPEQLMHTKVVSPRGQSPKMHIANFPCLYMSTLTSSFVSPLYGSFH